jgi:hypothetical protein
VKDNLNFTDTLILKGNSNAIKNEKNINLEEIISLLQKGEMFTKYGKKGTPHKRFVKLTDDRRFLIWRNMSGCNIFSKINQIKLTEVNIIYKIILKFYLLLIIDKRYLLRNYF